jgi:hypothetical protein
MSGSVLTGTALAATLLLPVVAGGEQPEWEASASAMAYFVPGEEAFVSPVLRADRGALHLEARYNYEDRGTASAWVGWNLSVGEAVTLDATPMLGGVFGDTSGIAPGFEVALGWGRFELYSEGEYLFESSGEEESFFYSWSEATFSPLEGLRVGLMGQRTRAYETSLDLQRGLLVGYSGERLDFTAYVLNLGWDDPTVIMSLGVSF